MQSSFSQMRRNDRDRVMRIVEGLPAADRRPNYGICIRDVTNDVDESDGAVNNDNATDENDVDANDVGVNNVDANDVGVNDVGANNISGNDVDASNLANAISTRVAAWIANDPETGWAFLNVVDVRCYPFIFYICVFTCM